MPTTMKSRLFVTQGWFNPLTAFRLSEIIEIKPLRGSYVVNVDNHLVY